MLHISMLLLVPAFGAGIIDIVTDADASGHVLFEVTVYVYSPIGSVFGSKIPVPLFSVGDHEPPLSGEPSSDKNRSKVELKLLSQISSVPFSPASGTESKIASTANLPVLSQGGSKVVA